MENKVIDRLDNPEGLESLYREKPERFVLWLTEAVKARPDSDILKVWQARLYYKNPQVADKATASLWLMIFLALILVFAVKLPQLIEVDHNGYYRRFIPFGIINALICYFMYVATLSTNIKRFIVAGSGLCFLLLFFLPDNNNSASILMATIHIPLVLSSLLAAAYMGNGWKQYELRLRYIRYLGEMLILTKIILLGGMVLALITFALFSVIGLSIGEWYMDNIVLAGLVAAPIVATYLYDEVLNRESKLATIISNVFAPLFLITVILYLSAMLYQQQSPYADRDFLISFNGLLVFVLAITVFSIAGKRESAHSRSIDVVNMALLGVTLLINTVALTAIVFRLTEYGVTPNRVVVTGANLLIFIHLILLLKAYIYYFKGSSRIEPLNKAVAGYLPVYSVWSVFISFALPLIFWFE